MFSQPRPKKKKRNPTDNQPTNRSSRQQTLVFVQFSSSHHHWHYHVFRYWSSKPNKLFLVLQVALNAIFFSKYYLVYPHYEFMLFSSSPLSSPWSTLPSSTHLGCSSWLLVFPLFLILPSSRPFFTQRTAWHIYKMWLGPCHFCALKTLHYWTWNKICTPCEAMRDLAQTCSSSSPCATLLFILLHFRGLDLTFVHLTDQAMESSL